MNQKKIIDKLLSVYGILICKKNYASISVSEISNEAKITRTTFYKYFENKDDMLERGILYILDKDIKKTKKIKKTDSVSLKKTIFDFFSNLEKKRVIIKAILHQNSPEWIRDLIKQEFYNYIVENTYNKYSKSLSDENRILLCRLKSDAIFSAMEFWISNEQEMSSSEISEHLFNFASVTLKGIFETNEDN